MTTDLIYEGVVLEKTPEMSFSDKNGTLHKECTLLVETVEKYPQRLAIRLLDTECATAPSVGKNVRCYLSCRVSAGASGKWFNNIKAWRVVVVS